MRSVFRGVAVLALAAVIGCVGCSGSGGKSAADARAELIATAKKMEGGMWVAVEDYVKSVERGEWSWSIADMNFAPGKFTPETIAAYQKWRAAKLAEDKTKKK
ncbi:MAG: hypothetical protein KF873_16885 [Gemmataceae bacterium]|nr:hypothetical protein [Gemmataceae bacterium]